jgi:C4-type Zn-finger protein
MSIAREPSPAASASREYHLTNAKCPTCDHEGLAREGRLRLTLVLKDAFGNSTIIFEKAKKRRISVRELKRLRFA